MALPRSRPRKNSASMLEKKCSQLTWRKPLVSTRHDSPWSSTAVASMPPSRLSKLDGVFVSDPALAAATRNAARLTAAMTAIATSDDSRFCRRTPAMFAGSRRLDACEPHLGQHFDERFDHRGVELRARAAAQFVDRRIRCAGGAERPLREHGVVRVAYRDDPRAQRDLVAGQP